MKKYIIFLLSIIFVSTLQGATKVQHTSDWKFTQEDFNNLTLAQKAILKQSYWVGKPHSLGHTIAAISIVETRAGAYPDKSRNRICGAHQVDVMIAKENLGTLTSPRALCKALQDNSVLSAMVSLEILLYWKDNSKTVRGMITKYSRGWKETPHDDEYYRRFSMVLKVLNKNNIESL